VTRSEFRSRLENSRHSILTLHVVSRYRANSIFDQQEIGRKRFVDVGNGRKHARCYKASVHCPSTISGPAVDTARAPLLSATTVQ
jgi:hypothetical protein